MERISRLTRGQAAPYASLPRIDWSHPLAEGLALYIYQQGTLAIDLVNGLQGHKSTTAPVVGSYIKGFGLTYGGGNAWTWWDSNSVYQNFGGTIPYSVVMATYPTNAAPASGRAMAGIVANDTSSNNASPSFATDISTTGDVDILFNNGASAQTYTVAQAANTFQTWGAVATSSTAADLYASGKFNKTATGITTTGSLAGLGSTGGPCLNNGSASAGNSVNVNGIVGFVPFYAGWNRQLTAAEFLQLHVDPYALLIYPEEELFIVGILPALGPGFLRREFEGLPIKPTSLELPPAWGIPKLAAPAPLAPVFNAPQDLNPFPQGRSEPTAKPFALTIPISHPIIYWREHDNVQFAKGKDDPPARGTSLAIPVAPPLIPRTSHDLNPFAQGKDEPPRMRILPLPTPSPVLLAPQIFNPFPPGKDDAGARGTSIQLPLANPVIFWREHDNVLFARGRDDPGARGTALTIPTVPPVYNAPHDLNPFALGRSEPPAIGWPKLTVAVLAAEVFNAPHDFNPFAQGKSEPSAWRILSLPTPRPVYNAPHDQNPYPQGVTLPLAWRVQVLPTPNPVLNAPQIFNPFALGRTDPPAWSVPPFPPVALPAIFNPPHDFNPYALGRSEAPAIGWPKLVIPVLTPIVFNAPAIHTPYVEGRSEPPVLRWLLQITPIIIPGTPGFCFASDKAIRTVVAQDIGTSQAAAKDVATAQASASDGQQIGQNIPPPPSGFVYLRGLDGSFLVGADGNFLLGRAP